ncbi:hypothetical protein FOMPIDRAFT_1056052 [Fomitopsis schrenkii]|uniref:DUF6532 domain-containing protein n=1 Tax=Fomitopsis schrenkii TaxID=2126942 RepID=S8DKR5_FOMSC|nr:hypothetical protein FOMPIDRAFT_1056052 [Fomitopsis schrenkii]
MRIAAKSAWTKEPAVKSTCLPTSDSMIETSLCEVYQKRTKTGKGDASLKAVYLSLQDQKGHDNEERAEMRKKVYTVVWSISSQTRNELKKKAKQVVEQAFKLRSLSVLQHTEAAIWLVKTHTMPVVDGTQTWNIPNFVYGRIVLCFDDKNWLDHQRTTLDRKQPFRSECITDLIYQYYGLAGREEANIAAAEEDFSKISLNLIALVCNAIESALMELVAIHQVNVFSNKHFTGK